MSVYDRVATLRCCRLAVGDVGVRVSLCVCLNVCVCVHVGRAVATFDSSGTVERLASGLRDEYRVRHL